MTSLLESVRVLAGKIAEGSRTVFFTGAGISTESGIPDFRSAGGIWTTYSPVYFDDFLSSRDARIEYWRQKVAFAGVLRAARPNAAHRAIAQLHEMGLAEAVITQNVDGMHQAAGMPDEAVIELHGNTLRVRCMSCRRLSAIEEAFRRIEEGDPAPECACGGFLKPDTISFGQAMPEDELRRAFALAKACDCLVVVGSTLVVQPAASIPLSALQAGAFLAIVNLSETPMDDRCDLLIRDKAGTVLGMLVEAVKAGRNMDRD